MSGICGWVGDGEPDCIVRMLSAIDYRGDSEDVVSEPGMTLGYRYWRGRPGKSPGIWRGSTALVACAGTLITSSTLTDDPPAKLISDRLDQPAPDFEDIDGAFAFAHWDKRSRTLTLARDPFGVRSLYYVQHQGTFYFATELKQLLALQSLPVEIDIPAIHKYLTFSFVPGEAAPICGIRRLMPGHILRYEGGRSTSTAYFRLVEQVDAALEDASVAVRTIRNLGRQATRKRLLGEKTVGLFLTGGLDSSSIAVWLKESGISVRAFSLDFGDKSVEKDQANAVCSTLGMDQTWVPVTGGLIANVFDDVVHKLDLPFGDPVTVPQYLLGEAARDRGLTAVFNGEGGDQLFGGWTSKPMIAAEIYSGLYESDSTSREESYLQSYHKFYGFEEELYTDDFKQKAGPKGQRRAYLQRYLTGNGLDDGDGEGDERDESFLHRVRLADISLKGSQNILPRAERMANAWGLDVRTPFFDRTLAQTAFRLPPNLKLHGACEKYVLKLAMQRALPHDIVWRKKFGMSVPVTDFVMTKPLSELVHDYLGESAIKRRGFFRPEFIASLLSGHDTPIETRRRRIGERIWTLLMLEAWMRRFVDRRVATLIPSRP